MGEFREYLRAYWAAIVASYGQGRAIANGLIGFVGLAGVFGLSRADLLPPWALYAWVGLYVFVFALFIWPYEMWKQLRSEIKSLLLPHGPIPDMTIKEFFSYASEGVDLLNPSEENWLVLGRGLKDRLSTDQLNAWGRPREDKTAPLVSIDPIYWRSAEFSYYFLGDMDGPHAWSLFNPLDEVRYYDIHLNRVQAQRIWRRT